MSRKIIRWLWVLPLSLVVGLAACTLLLVHGARVKSVQITPANPTVPVGGSQQFIANVTFSDGAIIQAALTAVTWASSNLSVATISSTGLATAISVGTSTITGTFEKVSGSTTLTVTTVGQVKALVAGSAGRLEVNFSGTHQRFLYVANPVEDVISLFRVEVATGEEQPIGSVSVAPAHGPTWIALDPSGNFLYVAAHGSGDISAFSIDPATGYLAAVPGSPFDAEGSPWSICVDPDGRLVLATHFERPDISRFRIDRATGALTPEK